MSDFYAQNDYRNYLQHHGIKGMHWGEQNGPPYPLSTKVHNMVVRGKQKRAAKRREKILNDPKKLYKHRKEFTKEEIDSALAKMESSERVRGKIRPTKGQLKRAQKKIEKERVKADEKLTKKMEKYAANAQMLEQNVDKFTPEELRAALNRVQTKQNVFDAKMSELNRPKRYLDLGLGYVDTAINAVNKFKTIKNLFTPKYDEHGMTEQDRMNAKAMEYIQDLAEKDPKKAFAVTASNSNYINNYTKLKESQNKLAKEEKKDKQSKQLEEQGNVIKEQKEDIRILRQENENLRSERDRAVANYAGVQNLNRINPQVIEYFDSTVEDARRNASDMNDWESYMERNSGGRAFDRINDRRAIRNSDISGDLDALIYSDISSIKMSDISSIFEENDKDFF